MLLVLDDFVPRYEDAGYTAVITEAARQLLQDDALLSEVNKGSLPDINETAFLTLYADLKRAGKLDAVQMFGGVQLPGTERYAAPTGLEADADGVWFTTPDKGVEIVRWYVNGELRAEETHNLVNNRYMALSQIDAGNNDVVQVCIVAGGVVGWWARITV